MKTLGSFAMVALGLSACVVSKTSLDDDGSAGGDAEGSEVGGIGEGAEGGDGASATSTSGSTGAGESGSTTSTTSPGGSEVGSDGGEVGSEVGSDVDSGGGSESGGVLLPPECMGIDHETCWGSILDACVEQGPFIIDADCVDAVLACYTAGPPFVAPADLIESCHSELSDCSQNNPGCGETYCTCTVGAYPFDWTNCWHLTLVACLGVESDCAGAITSCYPAGTVEDYQACKQQVIEWNNDCNCPMCGIHEECEDQLDACMGA